MPSSKNGLTWIRFLTISTGSLGKAAGAFRNPPARPASNGVIHFEPASTIATFSLGWRYSAPWMTHEPTESWIGRHSLRMPIALVWNGSISWSAPSHSEGDRGEPLWAGGLPTSTETA